MSCHQTKILNLVPVKTTMKEYGLLTFIHLSDTPFLNHNSCDNNCDNSYNLTPTIVDVIVVKEQLIVDQFSANS